MRRIPGFWRIVTLLDPVASSQLQLQAYLTLTEEKSGDWLFKQLDQLDLWRLPGLVAGVAGDKDAGTSSYYSQQYLLDYQRILKAVLVKLKEIDGWLLLYRFNYGS